MKELLLKNRHSIIFILIIFVATYLRFNTLLFNNYWLDELFSMDFSNPSKSFIDMLKITLNDVHPPFYQFLLWIWLKIFGFNEYAGRSLSALIGIICVIFSYYFSKEFFNKNISLSISFIFATNIFLIYFSQEVRSYQLTILLAMASYYYLYKTIIYKRNKNLYLYWLVTITWIYTHYYSFFLIASQMIFVLIFFFLFEKNKKMLIKKIIFTTIIFFASVIPLIKYILLASQGNKFWFLQKPSATYFLEYINFYFGYGGIYFVLLGSLITLYYVLTQNLKKNEKIILLMFLTWLIFGYLFPYLKSIFSSPLVQVRYSIVMIPPIIIISIYGIVKLKKSIQLSLLVLFSIFSLKVLFFDNQNAFYKHEYKKPLLYVSNYAQIPIYENLENGHNGNNTNHFQVYSDMLKLNLEIRDDNKLKVQQKMSTLPECFWIITSFYRLPIIKEEKDNTILIHSKKFHGIKADLFANKKRQKECLSYIK